MRTNRKNMRPKTQRKFVIPLIVVLVIAAAGGAYYYFSLRSATTVQAASTPTFNTAPVRRGNLTISASGSGTLVAGKQQDLNFATSGTVAKVNVQVGDVVKQGQELAQLGDLTTLQSAVNSAQQDLNSAQQALATLQSSASANIANAQLALSTAQKAVSDAKAGLIPQGAARCDAQTTSAYYDQWMRAKAHLDSLGDGGNQDYYLNTILPAKNLVAKDYATYQWCASFTSYEVSASQAKLDLANANYQTAQATLNTLTQNKGIDPTALATAQNKVDSAQVALSQAQQNLAGATITAPFNGTILSVAGQVGDPTGTAAFITIADLANPQVRFSIDETDMEKATVGNQATVTFDAIPGRTFTGKVARVNPSLVTSNNVQVFQGVIALDLSKEQNLPALPAGLNATVEIISAQAQNALLVPVQAIHDLGDGTYSVFVLQNGQLKLHVVTVGLMDAASAEIKTGLNVGDLVSTGSAQTR